VAAAAAKESLRAGQEKHLALAERERTAAMEKKLAEKVKRLAPKLGQHNEALLAHAQGWVDFEAGHRRDTAKEKK
jgi:hypothetical protein